METAVAADPQADAAADRSMLGQPAGTDAEAAVAATTSEPAADATAAATRGAADAAAAIAAAESAPAAAAPASTAEAKGAADAAAAVTASEAAPAADATAPTAEAKGAADAAAAVAAAEEPVMTTPAMGILPTEGLKPDTRLALNTSRDEIGYIGVWAPDYAACGTVDQAGGSGYVVITRISVRQGSELVLVDAVPATDGKATLKAGDKTIEIAQAGTDVLNVNGTDLVRCTTP